MFMTHTLRHNSKRLLLEYVLPAFIILTAVFIAFVLVMKTAIAGPGTEFGGQVSEVVFCDCSTDGSISAASFNDLRYPTPASPPALIYAVSTIVYQFGPPMTAGIWMLGTWQSGGECWYIVGYYCALYPTAGTMYMVGTSQ
jgi:hypothetical protein